MTLVREFSLPPFSRGLHLITGCIEKELAALNPLPSAGIVHLFLRHTSAAITISENCDPDVPLDLNDFMNQLSPDSRNFRHSSEGSDDMPAHIKSSLVGVSLSIPFSQGRLMLGTWQGIFLCEFRNRASQRGLVMTVVG